MHEVMSRRQRLPDPSGEGWLVRSSVTNSSGVPGLLTVLVPVGPVWPEPAVWFSGFPQHYLLLSSLGPHLPRLPFTQAPVQAVSPCAPPSVNSPPRFRPGSQYPPCLSPGSFPDLFVLVTQPRALPTVLGWAILPFSSPASSPPLVSRSSLPPYSPSHLTLTSCHVLFLSAHLGVLTTVPYGAGSPKPFAAYCALSASTSPQATINKGKVCVESEGFLMPLAHMCICTSLWHLHTYVHLYFFMALAHMCIYTPYDTCTICAFIFLYGTYTCMCIYTSLWYLHTYVQLYFLWHLFTYVHLCFFMAPAHTCALILPMAPVHVCAFILLYGTCTHM